MMNVANPGYLVCTNCIVRRDCKSLIDSNAEMLEALKRVEIDMAYDCDHANPILVSVRAAIAAAEKEER